MSMTIATDTAGVTRGAGIMFVAGGQVLFLKRGPGGDHPGEWCFPGGHVEPGETLEAAACRETVEEVGLLPDGERAVWARNISAMPAPGASQAEDTSPADVPPQPDLVAHAMVPAGTVDFTTFLQKVTERFDPTLNGEHTGFAWARPDEPPEPLHPGARIALAKLTMNELDVARAMMAGDLTSPQRYQNVTLFNIRITGTGTAYRSAHDEFVYRAPDNYLSEEFLARCNGLPVIWKHPKKALLTSKEFSDRIVGTIFLPYIRGDEVWGIAKIYDDSAIRMMTDNELSTSPAVLVGGPKVALEDGSQVLFEGKPGLVDHLAICEVGVWDKGGEPAGVDSDLAGDIMMTEEELKAKADAEAKAKADAEEEAKAKADAAEDKLTKFMDSMMSKMDSVCSRMDAFEAKAKADADATGTPEQIAADKARKDAEEAEAKKKADEEEKEEKAKADAAELRQRLADLDARLPKPLSDADYALMADAQARADEVFSAFGDSAPRPLQGETLPAYNARLAGKLKSHSAAWKAVDLSILPPDALGVAVEQIYADAAVAARNPTDIPAGQLRPIVSTDETGRRHTKFLGRPSAWLNQFGGSRKAVTAINSVRN